MKCLVECQLLFLELKSFFVIFFNLVLADREKK